jgi:hypothetical protein
MAVHIGEYDRLRETHDAIHAWSTRRAQNRESVSQALERIRQVARQRLQRTRGCSVGAHGRFMAIGRTIHPSLKRQSSTC